ncbi:MAG: AraC family transcriptional regulator ligand-binding domain-containing protein [Vitreimonas sp.]
MIARTKNLIAGNGLPGREPTVAAATARGLFDFAVQRGAGAELLSERSELSGDALADPDARVAYAKYVALMRAAKALTHDPALALHFGEAFQMSELSIVGFIGMASATIAEGIEQLGRFGQLIIDVPVDDPDGCRHRLSREGGKVWMLDTRSNPNEFPELSEASFARMAAASQRMRTQLDYIDEIHFTHAAPGHRADYDRVFQLPIVFESDRNALLMRGDAWLDAPLPQAKQPAYVLGVLSEHAERLLQNLNASQTTRGRVEDALLPALHKGHHSIEAVARKLGLSRQTLYTRLKQEGATFETVLNDLRHKLALEFLITKKLSVNETAYLVGFSDPAAFSRAFKRWTGQSPREFRSTHQRT